MSTYFIYNTLQYIVAKSKKKNAPQKHCGVLSESSTIDKLFVVIQVQYEALAWPNVSFVINVYGINELCFTKHFRFCTVSRRQPVRSGSRVHLFCRIKCVSTYRYASNCERPPKCELMAMREVSKIHLFGLVQS